MKLLAPFITWLYGLTNNFGITILISVVLAIIIIIPFQYLGFVNKKKKELLRPVIKDIQKKYNTNQLGVSLNGEQLSEELKKLSQTERDDMMSDEISAAYKKVKYHAFTGWIPDVFALIFVVLLYGGISGACPDGFYKTTLISAFNDKNTTAMIFLLAPVIISFVSGMVTAIKSVIKYKRGDKTQKTNILIAVAGTLLSVAVVVWIVSKTSVAISIIIVCFTVMNMIKTYIFEKKLNTMRVLS